MLWILKISCSSIIAWALILFQRWILARRAAPKIQGSMTLVVINNSREAGWLSESKYPWNDLMCPLSCFAWGELDHPSSLTLAPADARFQSGSESVSWGERVWHQQIGVLLWHIVTFSIFYTYYDTIMPLLLLHIMTKSGKTLFFHYYYFSTLLLQLLLLLHCYCHYCCLTNYDT